MKVWKTCRHFRRGEFIASICSPPFHVSEESYHCHRNECKHSNTQKSTPLALRTHKKSVDAAVQSPNIFSYHKNEANVVAGGKQGIVKLD